MVVILKDKINIDEKKLLLKEIEEYNKNKLTKINNEENEHLKGGGGKVKGKDKTKTDKTKDGRSGLQKFKDGTRRRLGKTGEAIKGAPGAASRKVQSAALRAVETGKRRRETRKKRKDKINN